MGEENIDINTTDKMTLPKSYFLAKGSKKVMRCA